MMESLIAFFSRRHLLTNLVMFGVFIGGVFAWQNTNKEELPDITSDIVRVSVRYPGAPSGDVEYFITKPVEEKIRGLEGVYRITSTSSVGSASISVELEPGYSKVDEALAEIKNAVFDVNFPEDVIDDPSVRVFRTSQKAVLDIALYHRDYHLLDTEGRRNLQQYALALESQLLNIPQVREINRDGYLQPELHVKIRPELLKLYRIPFNTVMREVRANHVRRPSGTIETEQEPKVTLLSELDTPEKLGDLIVQGGFEGQVIRLKEVAEIFSGYEKSSSILKVNGHEAVVLNVVKSGSYGILEALDEVNRVVETFRANSLEGSPVEAVLLDDESVDVRNRISLISINGAIGFVLIFILLFIFLNRRSGIWVGLGIPFTFCFTMICASLMGHTINGVTLAAVIIMMGIIVDDAIVVAENISRKIGQGMPPKEAAVKGAASVMLPVIASIATTCVAFVPLFFFQGRFARFIGFIPPVIFLMLGASLLESLFILPGHMELKLPWLERFLDEENRAAKQGHWFEKVEDFYGRLLEKILPYYGIVLTGFLILLVAAGFIFSTRMKFVMFPNEETRDIVLNGEAPPGTPRRDTARLSKQVEEIFTPYLGREVIGTRTSIAASRRGGAVEENKFRVSVEIVARDKRRKSADDLIVEWEKELKKLGGFDKLTFQKSRWGQDSGSPIEIVVQQNNDDVRRAVTAQLVAAMSADPALKDVEADEGLRVPEYRVSINRDMARRLDISPGDIASTLRASLEGAVLYEFSDGDEDVRVRFSTIDEAKDDIEKVMDLPIENQRNYLVPLRDIVRVEEVVSLNAIVRRDLKRTTLIDAGLNPGSKKTPLEIAEFYEREVFPKVLREYPTTALSFGGEVRDTRESSTDLRNAVIMVLLLIYVILAVLFNSMLKPFIIMLAIPFGVVGVVLAFWLHGKGLFGFYAAIGVLGLAGVVVNDSIIMLVRLEEEYDPARPRAGSYRQIAGIAKTRLRAVTLTTLTTVAGVLPTAYGFAGYDAMLADMMLALAWGMVFGTLITLGLIPCLYALGKDARFALKGAS
jgi:multidrug efflux pump subunit AcrB